MCGAQLPECKGAVQLAFENPDNSMLLKTMGPYHHNGHDYRSKEATVSTVEVATIIIGLSSFCALFIFIIFYCIRISKGVDYSPKLASVTPTPQPEKEELDLIVQKSKDPEDKSELSKQLELNMKQS